MFIVTLETAVGTCYLRGTCWTFAGRRERAKEFDSAGQAYEALVKAKKFMSAAHFRAAKIEEV